MGLLDDAIREHLELKRRHGGDPQEITQQEQEALGPVRRTVRGEEGDLDPEELAAAEADEAPPGETVPAELDDDEAYEDDEAPELPPPGAGSGAPAGPALADFGSDFDTGEHDAPAQAPHADDPSRPVADVDQPTEEWGFDDEEEAEEEPEPEEDPLEDTPDFLQETPEHDRLWFEQKPPKDFDFDG